MLNSKQIIEQCHAITANPLAFVLREKEAKDYHYVSSACVFIPEELLHAAGLIPIPLLGYAPSLQSVEKYLPSNCCEFARNMLETLCSDRLSFCDLLLFSHCCDTLGIIGDLAPRVGAGRVFRFNTPTSFDPDQALNFLNQRVGQLRDYLSKELGRTPGEEALRQSWEIYSRNYALAQQLYEVRRIKPGILSGYDLSAVILAGRFMPKEEHNPLLEQLVRDLDGQAFQAKKRKKILMSGSTNGNLELIQLVEASGCVVVADDLCETSRSLPLCSDQVFDFPSSQSRRILARFCPVKIKRDYHYSDLILERYEQANAQGVIFTFFTGCDAQFIDYASVKTQLKQKGIKSLTLEIVVGSKNLGQLQTRIEAFLESL